MDPRRTSAALVAIFAACGCAAPELPVEPATLPMSGYTDVRLDVGAVRVDPGEVAGVRVAGVSAYDLRVDGQTLVVTVQGAPTAGPADVELDLADGTEVFASTLAYEPPLDPLFDRVIGIGASLTQGVQGGVPTQHGQLHSPGRAIAVATGAYYALPLLVDPLFPTIEADDVGPAPECDVPDIVGFVASAAVDVLTQLNDPVEDRIDFGLALLTPEVVPSNVAVGGSRAQTVLDGPGDDFVQGFLARLVYASELGLTDPVSTTQLDLVDAAQPTLVVSTDLYGNDLLTAVVESQHIDPGLLTPADEMDAALAAIVDRLAATGAEVFLTDMPHVTVLPVTEEKRRAALANARHDALDAGEDPDDAEALEAIAVQARIDEVDAMGDAYNAMLAEHAGRHPNVHLVPFAARVDEIAAEPLRVGDSALTIGKLGGLLSTDGVHFSDTGYAMVADLVLETIQAELGVSVPPIDLAAVLADDPYAPANLRAAGLDPDACTP